ncbi:MAG: hypothetical protein HYY06_18975 [Deltaproteobacteria bacterium]|nr:hypothetical protein [Deltaproteobacteria bacterium]
MRVFLALALVLAACGDAEFGATGPGQNGDDDDDSWGDDGAEGEGEAEGEDEPISCPDFDLASLEGCCDDGEAHCVPRGSYPSLLEDAAEPCGDGVCIPDAVIVGGNGYTPPSCASIGDAAGVCVSICVPEVRANMGILPVDTCGASERCVPCVNPLTNEDTGVCNTLTCDEGGGEGEGEGEPPPEYTCENPPTEPVVDPALFGACCEGAHCVPNALVPADQAAMLASCDDDAGRCIPDELIETSGIYTAPTCSSIVGLEGRCMSTCIPDIQAQASLLPQSTCEATQRCVPCCDPFTGEETGACSIGCDAGPAAACTGVPAFPTCCDDDSGHCVPAELVPDDQEDNLDECESPEGDDDDDDDAPAMLCIPDVMRDPAFAGVRCVGQQLFGGDYDGVCLPDCLDIPFDFTMDEADCVEGYVCVPCTNPLTGEPSGAPGC